MNELSASQAQEIKDKEHIKLLVIFHYISGALGFFALLFLLLHFLLMNTFMGNEEMWNQAIAESQAKSESGETEPSTEEANPEASEEFPFHPFAFFKVFRWFYLFMGLFILAFIIMEFTSAYFMTKRKNRTFSIVVGGLSCLSMPIGTALGVMTIIVLLRPSVIASYERNQ